MQKSTGRWLLVVLVLGIISYGIVFFYNYVNNGGYKRSPSIVTTVTPIPTNAVNIKDMAFSPGSIQVKMGTTVTWTNQDNVNHNVVETDGSTGPSSPNLRNGQMYSFTFNKVGTYHYHCSIHGFTGTVEVTN